MADRDDDLRATSESVEADATQLAAIEQRKQTLPADDPRVISLSEEAERLGREILAKTRAETEIANEAAATG